MTVTLRLGGLGVATPLQLTGAAEDLRASLWSLDGPHHGAELGQPMVVEPGDGGWWLRQSQGRPVFADVPGRLLGEVVQRLNAAVTTRTPLVALHAAGLSWRGRGVLVVGPSGSGKSTLAAGLVRVGLDYLGDEAIGLDPVTGEALPYPKPLTLDPGAHRFFPELREAATRSGVDPTGSWHIPIDELREGAVGERCPVRVVVFCGYVPGAPLRVERISRAQGAFDLAECTFRFSDRATRSIEALAHLVRGADCYRLTTSDLEPAVSAVLDLAASERPPGPGSRGAAA